VGTRSGFSADVEGLQRLRAKLLAMAGPEAQAAMAKANHKSADEFAAGIRNAIPRGEGEGGHLVNTLKVYSPGGVAWAVTLGGQGTGFPYPFHLEAGHRLPDGTVVPAKPYWNPTKRVMAKRAKARAVRTERAAIKKITGG
jgi:hypothetical protein